MSMKPPIDIFIFVTKYFLKVCSKDFIKCLLLHNLCGVKSIFKVHNQKTKKYRVSTKFSFVHSDQTRTGVFCWGLTIVCVCAILYLRHGTADQLHIKNQKG